MFKINSLLKKVYLENIKRVLFWLRETIPLSQYDTNIKNPCLPEGTDGSAGGEYLAVSGAQVPTAESRAVFRNEASRNHEVVGAG